MGLAFTIGLLMIGPTVPASRTVPWASSFREARHQAAVRRAPILVIATVEDPLFGIGAPERLFQNADCRKKLEQVVLYRPKTDDLPKQSGRDLAVKPTMVWFDATGNELYRVSGGVGVARFLMETERMESIRAESKVADRWRASEGRVAQLRLAGYEAVRGDSRLAVSMLRKLEGKRTLGLSGLLLRVGYFHLGRSRPLVARQYFQRAERAAITGTDEAEAHLAGVLCDLSTQNYSNIRQRLKSALSNRDRLSARQRDFVALVDRRMLERFGGA